MYISISLHFTLIVPCENFCLQPKEVSAGATRSDMNRVFDIQQMIGSTSQVLIRFTLWNNLNLSSLRPPASETNMLVCSLLSGTIRLKKYVKFII